MKKNSTYALAFCGICIALNIVLGIITSALGIPLYLDTLGTMLSAAVLGPVPGMIVGSLSNIITGLIYSVSDKFSDNVGGGSFQFPQQSCTAPEIQALQSGSVCHCEKTQFRTSAQIELGKLRILATTQHRKLGIPAEVDPRQAAGDYRYVSQFRTALYVQ